MNSTGYLNGLRAIAAITVLVGHCFIWTGHVGDTRPFPSIGTVTKLAVDQFMLLSGFLMVFTTREGLDWKSFYIKRFFRIAPVYYLSLFSAIILSPYFLGGYAFLADRIGFGDSYYSGKHVVYSMWNIASHILFVFGLSPTGSFSSQLPDWSLSLEMQFYLMFPLVVIAKRRLGLLVTTIVVILAYLISTKLLLSSFREPSFLPFKLPVFLAGMIIAEAHISGRVRQIDVILIATLTMSQAVLYAQFLGPLSGFLNATVIAIVAGLMLLISTSKNTKHTAHVRLLDNWITQHLANWSYSIYLFHGFFIAILGPQLIKSSLWSSIPHHIQAPVFVIMVLLPTVAVSAFIFQFFEFPITSIGSRIAKRRRGNRQLITPNSSLKPQQPQ